MARNIEARLARLEAATVGAQEGKLSRVVRFVQPGATPGELQGYRYGYGQDRAYITRAPGEPEAEFTQRATAQALEARLPGCRVVLEEDRHWLSTAGETVH